MNRKPYNRFSGAEVMREENVTQDGQDQSPDTQDKDICFPPRQNEKRSEAIFDVQFCRKGILNNET